MKPRDLLTFPRIAYRAFQAFSTHSFGRFGSAFRRLN